MDVIAERLGGWRMHCVAAFGSDHSKVGIMAYRSSMCYTNGVAIACGFEDSWALRIAKE